METPIWVIYYETPYCAGFEWVNNQSDAESTYLDMVHRWEDFPSEENWVVVRFKHNIPVIHGCIMGLIQSYIMNTSIADMIKNADEWASGSDFSLLG